MLVSKMCFENRENKKRELKNKWKKVELFIRRYRFM